MKKNIILLLVFTTLIFSLNTNLFADSDSKTPEPYKTEEFPQTLKDFRRFEIITLGSMPFIMLDASIAYSGYKYIKGDNKEFNFFGSNSYTYEETKNMIITSLCISASIGLTDYFVRLVKRSSAKKKAEQRNNHQAINIQTTPNVVFDISDLEQLNEQTEKNLKQEDDLSEISDNENDEFKEIDENQTDDNLIEVIE